jgi:hypothetical protein
MKDSVINSNPNFDFGPFLTLETEMARLRAQNSTTPVIFTFTFVEAGNYVFYDNISLQRIMIVSVKGLGEECADPNRYLQTISEESLAEIGASIKLEIIVEPNYPLIVALGLILLFSTAVIMIFIGWCLHKNWEIPSITDKMKANNCRLENKDMDIGTGNNLLYEEENEFIIHKSELIDSEEDDLDNFNLDI